MRFKASQSRDRGCSPPAALRRFLDPTGGHRQPCHSPVMQNSAILLSSNLAVQSGSRCRACGSGIDGPLTTLASIAGWGVVNSRGTAPDLAAMHGRMSAPAAQHRHFRRFPSSIGRNAAASSATETEALVAFNALVVQRPARLTLPECNCLLLESAGLRGPSRQRQCTSLPTHVSSLIAF